MAAMLEGMLQQVEIPDFRSLLNQETDMSKAPSLSDLKSSLQDLFPPPPEAQPDQQGDICEVNFGEDVYPSEVTLEDGTVVHLPEQGPLTQRLTPEQEGGTLEAPPGETADVKSDAGENEFCSTYKERLDQTPKADSERGEWAGERGESEFIPSDPQMQETLSEFGMEGVTYKDAIPDFSPCSETTVEIANMSENRKGKGNNFDQCDHACAEQWNKEGRDGRTDWTARDVSDWREKNDYTWHERNNMKTCDLIPTKVNDYFGHLGGVGECRRRDNTSDFGGEFDD